MSKDVYIFDMDGTLINTDPGFYSCLNSMLSACGKDRINMEKYLEVCYDTRDWFELLFTEGDLVNNYKSTHPELIELFTLGKKTYVECFRKIFSETYLIEEHYKKAELFDKDATINMLTSLRNSGAKLIVSTNSSGEHARHELSRLGIIGYFHHIVGSGDVLDGNTVGSKPNLEVFKAISSLAKIHPLSHKITMVGDTISDMMFAENSNIDFILLSKQTKVIDHIFVQSYSERSRRSLKILPSIVEMSNNIIIRKNLLKYLRN